MKEWLRQRIRDPQSLLAHRELARFRGLLADANLWHLNRRSAAGAVAVGLFVTYLPTPGQMVVAAAVAFILRVNLPIAAALAWVSNPLTTPAMLYCAYVTGAWVSGLPVQLNLSLEFWREWNNWKQILGPLGVGLVVCATISSAVGYFLTQALWRWSVERRVRRRGRRGQSQPRAGRVPVNGVSD